MEGILPSDTCGLLCTFVIRKIFESNRGGLV